MPTLPSCPRILSLKPVFLGALAMLITQAPLSRAQVDLETGLEVYYTFDEGGGNQAGDVSGNLRTAEVYETPQLVGKEILWTQGRFGSAVDIDGTYFLGVPEYFGIGGKGARTVSMWVNTLNQPSGTTALVAWGPNVNEQRWHFKFESSTSGVRTENQGGNIFGALPVVDGTWHHIVCVFPEGGETLAAVDHYVDGVLDTTENGNTANPVNTVADPLIGPPVTIGGAPFNAGLRFSTTLIDDVRIYSRALTPDEIAALAAGEGVIEGAPPLIGLAEGIEANPFVDAAQDLEFSATPVGSGAVITDVKLFLNGVDVTSETDINPGGVTTFASYSSLEVNATYDVEIQATDSRGFVSVRKFSFGTFSESNFMIEAEDYNFAGGQFINDPVLCNVLGGMEGCYFDRVSIPGIDSFDGLGFADDTASIDQVYRFSTGAPTREEQFDTIMSADTPRTRYVEAFVNEYEVNLLNAGDWANYTRTFPEADAFRILLRARASATQTVRLERVSNPTGTEQEVTLLGTFLVPASTSYGFVPLTDLAGEKELTVTLTGEQTLRLTAVDASNNLNLNYLMFIPTTDTAILPTVAFTTPAENSVHPAGSAITFQADADDEDGFVTEVTFTVLSGGVEIDLGTDTEAPFEAIWSDVPEGVHTAMATVVDDDGLEGISLPLRIIVDSTPPVVTAVHESPTLDAIELIFSEPIDVTSGQVTGNYQINPAVSITSATVTGQRVVLATAPLSQGVEYTVTAQGVKDANGITQAASSGSFTAGESSLLYGLELYLTFDEGAGPLAVDLSGYGRDAVMYNAVEFAGLPILWTGEGQFSSAVNFDGNYFLGVPGYHGIGGANPRTISMWINTDWEVLNNANALMGWGRNATSQRWHFKLEGGAAARGALRTENQGGNNVGSIVVNDGQWHHVVVVFPDFATTVGEANHYVDGVLDLTKTGTTGTLVDTGIDPAFAPILTVGGAPLNAELRRVTGVLDDVRLYNRALSDTEIQALFAGEGVLAGTPIETDAAISISRSSTGEITLEWERGVLQTTPAIGEEWTDVEGAQSPHEITPSGTAFFRLIIR